MLHIYIRRQEILIMIPKTCDVKGCIDSIDQVLVMHHCEHMKNQVRLCKFDPYQENDDEFHCVFRFCDKHADTFRVLQKSESQDKSEMQFKEDRHTHRT
jgi:hypothetical protein